MATKNVAAKAALPKVGTPPTKEMPDVKAAPPKALKAAPAKVATVPVSAVAPEDNHVTLGKAGLADSIRHLMLEQGIAVTLKLAITLVESFEAAVSSALGQGNDVALPGFGKFKVSLRAGGERRNPSNGEMITVTDSWAVGFKVGSGLKTAVNQRPVP